MPKYYHAKTEFRIIPEEDVRKLIDKIDQRGRALVALAWITGARLHEMTQLQMEDMTIDETKNEMRIRLTNLKTKNKGKRELVLSLETPFIKEFVIPALPSIGKVFPLSDRYYQLFLEKANKETNLWIPFHEFRHSRLSYLARKLGATMSELMDWTGWDTPTQVGVYVIKASPERFKEEIK